jgi:Nif-specific regulatory protein
MLDLVITATDAERGALFVKKGRKMELSVGRNIDHSTLEDANELSRSAVRELGKDKVIFIKDARSNPQYNIKKSVMLHQIRSILCIPLIVSSHVIGAIYLDSRIKTDVFNQRDIDFITTVARILASVIEKSMIFQLIREENVMLRSNIIQEIGKGYLTGRSKSMRDIYALVDDVAQSNAPVLILGETGTGKGMIARLIHLKSTRKDHNFMTINCGTIPETLLESELFGHKKGAFTGAYTDKKGLLEEAHSGTIFLDEVTNTSAHFQAKILEAIEEKVIRRIGETMIRKIDVRFVFASNKDIEIEVEEGRFRRDLYYRINVFSIEIPPLRDRRGDIPLLAQFFLERYSRELNKRILGFTEDAMQQLKDCIWQGNIRELQNTIERAVVLTKNGIITPDDLNVKRVGTAHIASMDAIKKQAIVEALNVTNRNIKKAAEILGISRRTIERYVKRYRIIV